MNASVQRMLDQALGAGNAVVQISADLDFDNTETKTQKYVADPATPPLAETTKTATYTGAGGTPTGGVLGPDNIQVPAGAGGTGSYEQSESTKNNAVGVVTEVRKSAPGAVKKLSVAVMINSDSVQGANEAQLQQLISSAVGLDATRGDTIAVSAMSFDKTGAEAVKKELEAAQTADQQAATMSMIKTGALIFGVFVLILMAFVGNKRRQKKMQKALQAQIDRFEAEQAELAGAKVPAAIGAGNAVAGELTAGPPVEIDPAVLAREERSREITSLATQQPEDVVTLLRGWLADRRG
jgi:flagellar M-ring protein FliF